MSNYDRSTTSLTLATLPEPIRGAIREKAEALLLTIADDAPAFLTHSRQVTKKKTGLFGRGKSIDPDVEHHTALVIGAKDVLVCTSGEKRGTHVLAARLESVDTQGLSERVNAAAGVAPGDGVSVNGFPVPGDGSSGRGSFYVGLGAPDGDAARAALEAAIRAAKA